MKTEKKRKFRYENKYVINIAEIELIRNRVVGICDFDKYALEDGEYNIRSLYFDNYGSKAFYDNEIGIEPREKFRIRIYNCNSDVVVLERKIKIGGKIKYGDILEATVVEIVEDGNRIVEFSYDSEKYSNIFEVLNIIGSMPLPPYITEKLEDRERYQTVYARENGSSAAPTAGLHFTKELMAKIEEKGIKIVPVMLHVGLGTFRPVKADKITDHIMHAEYISVSEESARIINERKRAGGRIIAVGTTSCRVLESVATEDGKIQAISGETGIFIYPGYKFKAVDTLITNFHLPESTLLMLVSALAGKERIMDVYKTAVNEKYRFFSFGDAMMIE